MTKMPELWSTDLPAVVRWIRQVVANSKQEQTNADQAGTVVSSESVGMARLWYGPEVPEGWTSAWGTLLFVSEAPDLYSLIGDSQGVAPANMFKLPPAPPAAAGGIWILKK